MGKRQVKRMTLKGNCQTTAMGILPHTDLERAIDLALTLDIPFWPQLPRYSFYEDMYVQVSEHFPGIRIDEEKQRIQLNLTAFYEELPEYAQKSADEGLFFLSPQYSVALQAFLARDLRGYATIRGQCIGPLSFGLKITTEDLKPIIYNDDVRMFLFDFLARKVNAQVKQLQAIHPNAFVWVDEPGLEILFGSFTGLSQRPGQGAETTKEVRDKYENLDTVKAYNLKLSLRSFFEQPDRKAGEEFLKRWYFWATHSRLVPIVNAAYTIKDHWEGILNWFSSRITNDQLEGLNSLIQAAKARARGYRNKENFIILYNCQ